MKTVKVNRRILVALAEKANEGETVVCVCDSARHVTAFCTALLVATLEKVFDKGNVHSNPNCTVIEIGEGAVHLVEQESYDPSNFPDKHKALRLES